jgi:hypothetical protein
LAGACLFIAMGSSYRANGCVICWVLPVCVILTGCNPEEWPIDLAVDAPSL